MLSLFPVRGRASSDEYLHDFERRSDLEAWQSYDETAACTLANPGSGGSPGGYLQVRCGGRYVGAWTRSSDFTGSLAASRWRLGFDVANFTARHADLFDVIVFGADTFWIYLGTLAPATGTAWTSYEVTFDPAWSDDEARANGWAPAASDGAAAARWAVALKQVEAIGFRARAASSSDVSDVQIGIDNVRLGATP